MARGQYDRYMCRLECCLTGVCLVFLTWHMGHCVRVCVCVWKEGI